MKKFIRMLVEGSLNTIVFILPTKKGKASFLSLISRLFIQPSNIIEYDANYDMYWLKSMGNYLFMVKKPYFYFSKAKLFKGIKKVACKYYVPKKGDVIVDIGAGIGTETLFFKEHIQDKGKIYAIEASKASHEKLVEMCAKNNIENSENLHLAITDQNQSVWIEETENYQVDALNTNDKGIRVDGVTLDHLVADKQIKRIDFLKVNIEGSELPMIEGMQKSIKIIENIAVSCHDFLFDDDRKIKETMTEFLITNGFEVFFNTTGNQVVDSWIYGTKN